MYGCESWTIKKAECQRTDAFELWCWRRLLRVPWAARRPNQSILKEISPEYHWKDWCWNWSSNTLATCYEVLTHGKDPDTGEDWRQEEKGMTEDEILDGITDSMDMSLSKIQSCDGQGSLTCCSLWGSKKSDTTEQPNWIIRYFMQTT